MSSYKSRRPEKLSNVVEDNLTGGNAMPLGGVGGSGEASRSKSSSGVTGAAAETRMLAVRRTPLRARAFKLIPSPPPPLYFFPYFFTNMRFVHTTRR